MKTSQLLKILPDEDKKEFIKDYYNQVKEGLKEANTTAWKFCFYSILIVLLYYAFDADLIKKISLGRITLEDVNLVKVVTPLLFSFCYYLMALNLARYNELEVQYDALVLHFTKDINLIDERYSFHSSVLPNNYINATVRYLLNTSSGWGIFFAIVMLIPLLVFFSLAIYFLVISIYYLPFKNLPVFCYIVSCISGYLLLLTLIISGRSNNQMTKERKLVQKLL